MDSAARSSIIDLIESATDLNAEAPGPAAARDRQLALLALLSKGDAYVDVAHSTLQTKLQAKHAMVANALFRSSQPFRRLLTHSFQQFLELTVGYRPEKPLPPPVDTAEALRQQALEVVERWRDQHGRECPQLVSGCRYLRDCLGLRLPELRARAAHRVEQQAARRARTQQLLLERFWAIPQELATLRQEAERLLSQLQSCEDLLLGRQPHPASAPTGSVHKQTTAATTTTTTTTTTAASDIFTGPGTGPGTGAAAAARSGSNGGGTGVVPVNDSLEGVEWEDVDADAGEGQGLAAYATFNTGRAPAGRGSSPASAAVAGSGLDEGTRQGLLDSMSDLARQLASKCVERLRSWMQLLVQLDLTRSGPGLGPGANTAFASGLGTGASRGPGTRSAAVGCTNGAGSSFQGAGPGTSGGGTAGNMAPGGGALLLPQAGRAGSIAATHTASAEQGLATARLQRDRLLRQVVDLRGQVQSALAQARALGAHVPEAALQEPAAAATAAAVNISLTVTAAGVEAEDSNIDVDEEDGDGEGSGLDDGDSGDVVGGGLPGAEEGDDGEEEEESRQRSGVRVQDDAAASRGLARVGQQQPVAGKRRREDGGSFAAATPAFGSGGLQPEMARAVERAAARTARMGRFSQGVVAGRGSRAVDAGASAAAVDAAACSRLSYNDQMITGQGDEAAARQLQLEMVEQAAAAAAPSQRAAARKGAKLTGKALIRKQLGLR